MQYTIGDDVISQTYSTYDSSWTVDDTQYLLYDGHGSTRQLIEHTLVSGEVVIAEEYDYDGYGVATGFDASSADTNLLYTGEQYDSDLSQYYLRARYYDPANGRFNRMDPFAGNSQDPQSLHKYLYCHANPINGIDPSGKSLVSGLMITLAVFTILAAITVGFVALRTFMIRSGARGNTVFVDFSNFDLSGITFTNGSEPNGNIVRNNLLRLMNDVYNEAEVSVVELQGNHSTTITTPILSFTGEGGIVDGDIVFGNEMVGGARPEVHLGNFRIEELNGKLDNNQQLARAIAFLACHEVGHSYKLDHLDESGNIMRSRVVLNNGGTGPGGGVTADDVIRGLLRPSSFTSNQIEDIKNVAETGRIY